MSDPDENEWNAIDQYLQLEADGQLDEDGDPWGMPRRPTRCKYCGSEQVRWIETNYGWRLYDVANSVLGTPMMHTCDAYYAAKNRCNRS